MRPALALLLLARPCASLNSTASWLAKRASLTHDVFGYGPGILSTKSVPDQILEWPDEPGLQGLVWDLTTFFPITSTVFFSPVRPGQRSRSAFFFHQGHSDCVCPTEKGDPPVTRGLCRPGCNSSMPTEAEVGTPGYSWWDLYNVSDWVHSLGFDIFIFSMPLKGVNLGPGSTQKSVETNHWFFLQYELKGDRPLRYFIEPIILTANYAVEAGYEEINMAGLSGGGWSATLAPAIDVRIKRSFPIAGSVPCAMRNPLGPIPGQKWTGNDDEDFEQSCMPHNHSLGKRDDNPGRTAYQSCNYTCQYLLAGLEPGRFQVQILHEYDNCCFSPHGRHDQMLEYEANVRAELSSGERADGSHGWFTSTANEHRKHEVSAQDKTLIAAALAGDFAPKSPQWQSLECDILHQRPPGGACAANVEPGLKAEDEGASGEGHFIAKLFGAISSRRRSIQEAAKGLSFLSA